MQLYKVYICLSHKYQVLSQNHNENREQFNFLIDFIPDRESLFNIIEKKENILLSDDKDSLSDIKEMIDNMEEPFSWIGFGRSYRTLTWEGYISVNSASVYNKNGDTI